ncbi:UNVERIFIED_CONTAM: hypothetical protein K2H54_036993 [Gekko kuhli]
MASREEDGFLSLHETETAGQATDNRDRGAAKRAAAGSQDERSGGSKPKRAKTAARAAKEPGPTAAAILDDRRRNTISDGDGLQGPNPHTERPDAMSYSGTEDIRHEQPCRGDANTAGGLKTALVERDDFSSGTSSRSTKLIHGGVRYLQKAIMRLDFEQYRMVKEALYERANLLEIAPHLSAPLPIMLPVYRWWQLPYYWVGIKLYDLVAGSQCLKSSYVLSKSKALELFPMLRKDKLVGAIVYYDAFIEVASQLGYTYNCVIKAWGLFHVYKATYMRHHTKPYDGKKNIICYGTS